MIIDHELLSRCFVERTICNITGDSGCIDSIDYYIRMFKIGGGFGFRFLGWRLYTFSNGDGASRHALRDCYNQSGEGYVRYDADLSDLPLIY